MARIVLTTFGSLGDLHPYLALALELKRRADGSFAVFADDTGSGVCAGFGVGIAGVGSFFSRLVSGGPRPLLLDELLPTRAAGP